MDEIHQFTGREIVATLQSGQSEKLVVRQFTMKDVQSVLDVWPNMVRVCERALKSDVGPVPSGYCDMLTVDSFAEVMTAVEEVNASFFGVCRRLSKTMVAMLGIEAPKG
jgi:hypothetical protein